jgi:hypothetical protein
MSDPRLRYLVPLALWSAAAVAITLIEGAPDRLPAVALGSTVLLHALRAAALFAVGFAQGEPAAATMVPTCQARHDPS